LTAGCSYLPFFGDDYKPGPLPDFKASANPRVAWQAQLGTKGRPGFAPAVADGKLYAATSAGAVVNFDLASGKEGWRISTRELSAGVGASAKNVIAGTGKGDVLAFGPDGKALWTSRVSSEVLSPPQVLEGMVVVWSGDGRIYGLSAADGKRLWTWQQSTPSLIVRNYAGGIVTRGAVFTGLSAGKMLALNLNNGAVGWDANISTPKGATELERISDVTSLPVVDERQTCAVAYQGRVACFDLTRGSVAWTRDISSFAGIALDERNLYITDDKGNVQALDKSNGASVWKQDKLSTRRPSGPQFVGDYVAVDDVEGYVHLLSRNDGSFVGRVATDGTPAVGQPVRAGDGLALISAGGSVFYVTAN
jgi:outer membrane protein assembly factor BamB